MAELGWLLGVALAGAHSAGLSRLGGGGTGDGSCAVRGAQSRGTPAPIAPPIAPPIAIVAAADARCMRARCMRSMAALVGRGAVGRHKRRGECGGDGGAAPPALVQPSRRGRRGEQADGRQGSPPRLTMPAAAAWTSAGAAGADGWGGWEDGWQGRPGRG